MNEMSNEELMAALAFNDLGDYEIVIKVGNRYVIGMLNSLELKYETGDLSPSFSLNGFVRSRN